MENILFNTEMTKAILDGRKTQTRRVVIPQPTYVPESNTIVGKIDAFWYWDNGKKGKANYGCTLSRLPNEAKYKKGETIWVREPAKIEMCFTKEIHYRYLAYNPNKLFKMPIPQRFIKDGFVANWMAHCKGVPNGGIKEMARIFLKITNVKVERLQDISGNDMLQEGYLKFYCNKNPLNYFIYIWDKTAQKGYKWEDNPFVFVYEFERSKNENF